MATSARKDDTITSEILFFITDCLVDEFEPDEVKAISVKSRMRRIGKNFISHVRRREAEKLLLKEQSKSGLKRKEIDSDLPEVSNSLEDHEPGDSGHEHVISENVETQTVAKEKPEEHNKKANNKKASAPDGKPNKKRKTSAHTAYISYGMGVLNELIERTGMVIPGGKRMQIVNSYKEKKPEALMKQFEYDYSDALDEINEESEKLPKGFLYGKFRAVDKIKSYTVHPLFADFADFIKEFLNDQEPNDTKAKANGAQEAKKASMSDAKAWKYRKTIDKKSEEVTEPEGKAGKSKSSIASKAEKQAKTAEKEKGSKKVTSENTATKAAASRGAKKSLVKAKEAAPVNRSASRDGAKKKETIAAADDTEEEYSNDEEADREVEEEGGTEGEETGNDSDEDSDEDDDE